MAKIVSVSDVKEAQATFRKAKWHYDHDRTDGILDSYDRMRTAGRAYCELVGARLNDWTELLAHITY